MSQDWEFITRADLEAQNPINMLKSTWFLLIAGVSGVWFIAGLYSSVEGNTESISKIENTISEIKTTIDDLPKDIKDELKSEFDNVDQDNEDQEEKFDLFLESMKSLRNEMNAEFDSYDDRFAETDRRLLLLENQ